VQNCSGSGLLNLLKYSITDAGVSGEGTQSANALPLKTTPQSLAMWSELVAAALKEKLLATNLCASSLMASGLG
jgi:hypothetical protein